nr:hypothetical protein B0A51_05190 [Rachicladosporium sp. CCFEE 5018]
MAVLTPVLDTIMTNAFNPSVRYLLGHGRETYPPTPTRRLSQSRPFGPLIAYYSIHGYSSLPNGLPSTHSATPATFANDVTTIHAANTGALAVKNVVLVAHSFGGITGLSSLEYLTPAARKHAGYAMAVTQVCLISAFLGFRGTSVLEMLGDRLVPISEIRGDWCCVGPKSPREYFIHDLPAEEAEKWAAVLKPCSVNAFLGKVTHEWWREAAVSYLVCKQDQTNTEDFQRWSIGEAKRNGVAFRVEKIESSHCPFLSQVERTGDFVRRGVGGDV